MATQHAFRASLYLMFGVIWCFALSPLVGAAWIALGLVFVRWAWRARPPVN